MVFCAWQNLILFKKVPPANPTRKKWPKVSVLIPARNEEKRIGPLLESLLRQDYPHYEILVLDDRSSDGTLALVKSYSRKNKRLRVIPGKNLPPDWRGKPWACQQLSTRAKGEWLLFTDADTCHDPDMLKRSVQYAQESAADVVSLMNEQVTGSWMEKLVVPVMVFSLVCYFPGAWALKPRNPWSRFAGVGGQFILIRREVYRSIGGHEVVKKEIVEDLSLGRELVQRGRRVVLGNGSDFTRCRMYRSAREVWEGFSKNMFPAAGYSLFRMGAILAVLLGLGAAPFGLIFLGPSSPFFFPSLILALSQWAIRWTHARRYKMSQLSVWFHPLGSFLFALIGINSICWFLMGRGHWKGRSLQPLSV